MDCLSNAILFSLIKAKILYFGTLQIEIEGIMPEKNEHDAKWQSQMYQKILHIEKKQGNRNMKQTNYRLKLSMHIHIKLPPSVSYH